MTLNTSTLVRDLQPTTSNLAPNAIQEAPMQGSHDVAANHSSPLAPIASNERPRRNTARNERVALAIRGARKGAYVPLKNRKSKQ
ncbi:hypothetical protein FS749_004136 [Ceratobasidium sp. UAMH 11750]|nr:hypothetical protein FS749_004136 [Ceratobasidium sp. UAMH 11750]